MTDAYFISQSDELTQALGLSHQTAINVINSTTPLTDYTGDTPPMLVSEVESGSSHFSYLPLPLPLEIPIPRSLPLAQRMFPPAG